MITDNGESAMLDLIQEEKIELLKIIAQRIEQQARLESELGVDFQKTLGLPRLEDLKRGLEILRRELALASPAAARPGCAS
jgi:hypothetical protein